MDLLDTDSQEMPPLQQLDLSDLREQLSGFDRADLLAKVGALNLDPSNGAGRTNSLEALAHLVASLAVPLKAPRISQTRFRNLISEHLDGLPFHGNPDDNAPQSFAVEFLVIDESFLVFPGHAVEITDNLQWLLNACLSQRVEPWPQRLMNEVVLAAKLCLGVSRQIALRSGITRGTPLKGDRNSDIAIPDLRILRARSTSVTFSHTDLATIIPAPFAVKEVIAPLSIA